MEEGGVGERPEKAQEGKWTGAPWLSDLHVYKREWFCDTPPQLSCVRGRTSETREGS